MEQRLTIITLGVPNVQKSTEFYESNFGWQKSEHSNKNITFFTLNSIQFSLYQKDSLAKDANVSEIGNGFNKFTLAHNVKSENEVDELIQKFKSKGVEIIKEPIKASWGGYSGYISDLDGFLWEIAFNPFLEF